MRRRLVRKTQRLIIAAVVIMFILSGKVYAEEYEYDNLNRVVKVTYDDGSYVTYTYDNNGNIKNIEVHEKETVSSATKSGQNTTKSEVTTKKGQETTKSQTATKGEQETTKPQTTTNQTVREQEITKPQTATKEERETTKSQAITEKRPSTNQEQETTKPQGTNREQETTKPQKAANSQTTGKGQETTKSQSATKQGQKNTNQSSEGESPKTTKSENTIGPVRTPQEKLFSGIKIILDMFGRDTQTDSTVPYISESGNIASYEDYTGSNTNSGDSGNTPNGSLSGGESDYSNEGRQQAGPAAYSEQSGNINAGSGKKAGTGGQGGSSVGKNSTDKNSTDKNSTDKLKSRSKDNSEGNLNHIDTEASESTKETEIEHYIGRAKYYAAKGIIEAVRFTVRQMTKLVTEA